MRHILTCLLFLALTTPLAAQTNLMIVGNYDRAGEESLWNAPEPYQVPEALIQSMQVQTPSRAYSYPYPNVFLQNERVIVCDRSCEGVQNVVPEFVGDNQLRVPVLPPTSKAERARNESMLRQMTVYYWVNRVLSRVEELGHRFDHRLKIMVDREVSDIETGEALTNNAFFLSTDVDVVDWSLSFLPAEGGMGQRLLPSGYDPSVAIHEATHFIFQEMVGDILNQEIYGLHEAFADYFALSILESPDVGLVMLRGEPLRTGSTLLRYEPNMEVHDLGNVVVAALWNIREAFPDKDLADKVVFETIYQIGANPFASASSVMDAYYIALNKVAADTFEANPGLLGEIDRTWTATKLKAPPIVPNLSALDAPLTPEESAQAVTVSIQLNTPREGVLEFGVAPIEKTTLTLITTRPGPEGTDYRWYLVALQDLDATVPVTTPFWILYSPEANIIRYAYTLGGEVVTTTSERIEDYRRLVSINDRLRTLLDYGDSFAGDMLTLLDTGRWAHLKAKKRHVERSDSYFSYGFPGRLIPMHIYRVPVRPTVGSFLISFLGAPHLRATEEILLFTISPDALTTERLPISQEDEALVGYELVRKTGFRMALRLDDLGESP